MKTLKEPGIVAKPCNPLAPGAEFADAYDKYPKKEGESEMKTSLLLSIGLTVIVIIVLPQRTFGQLTDFLTSPGYSSMIKTMIDNKLLEKSTGNSARQTSNGTSREPGSRSSAQVYEVPAYRKYPAVQFKPTGTRLTLQEYLDSVSVGPKEKAELKSLILSMWDAYEAEAVHKGYPNDLALALVACIEVNSHVYNGRSEKLPFPFGQNLGQRDTLAEYATDNGTFNRLTDREKQKLYELFVMLGGLTYHFYEKARKENNAKEIEDAKLTAAYNLKLLGVKP